MKFDFFDNEKRTMKKEQMIFPPLFTGMLNQAGNQTYQIIQLKLVLNSYSVEIAELNV